MAIRKTTEKFIEDARRVHGDKFDYSGVSYQDQRKKIKIECKEHGIFEQAPHSHLSGSGCKTCVVIGKRRAPEQFIKEARHIHGDSYSYSKAEYITNAIKVCIICPIHGDFWTLPTNFLNKGSGCKKCTQGGKRLNANGFISRSIERHGERYDYSIIASEWKGTRKKVPIICKLHGTFWQRPDLHYSEGKGCPECGRLKRTKLLEAYIKQARSIHGRRYDYDHVIYSRNNCVIDILCGIHGKFSIRADHHLDGYGCQKCNITKGESKIEKWLKINKINYVWQYRPSGLRMAYDFFLPEYDLLIEFDGKQHFEYVDYFFRTQDKFQRQQELDEKKKQFAEKNGLDLLRIPHWEYKNIDNILTIEVK